MQLKNEIQMKDRKIKNSKLKRILTKIMIFICLIVFFSSSYLLYKSFSENKKTNESINNLIETVIKKNTKDNTSTIDWKKLKDINSDIIGWIKINDTNINYPILQDKDLFYLNHNYNKEYNPNGSLFILDKKPFETEKTIIYGHNMKNKLMFSELSNYLNEDFFYSHNTIEIYTLKNNYKATIFSAYSIKEDTEESNISSLTFNDEIKYYLNKSKFKVSVENVKKIIKLSTCSYLNSRQRPTPERYYIIAKLEKI